MGRCRRREDKIGGVDVALCVNLKARVRARSIGSITVKKQEAWKLVERFFFAFGVDKVTQRRDVLKRGAATIRGEGALGARAQSLPGCAAAEACLQRGHTPSARVPAR